MNETRAPQHTTTRTKRRLLVLICVLILLPACALRGSDPSPAERPLEASGLIEGEELTLALEMGGVVAEVAVAEGVSVDAGELLIRLDETSLKDQLAQAQARVEAARASRDLVAAGPRPGEVAGSRAAVSSAHARYDGALEAWRNAVTARDNPQELDGRIVALRAELETAKQQVEQARLELQATELERDQTEPGSDARRVQDARVRAAASALDAVQATRDGLQAQLYRLRAIEENPLALETQVHAAAGRRSVAAAELRLAQARLEELKAHPGDAELAVAEATLRQARADADVVVAKSQLMTLTAPQPGLVSAIAAHEGEAVQAGAPLLTLTRLDPLRLTLYIPATRIGQVTLGQSVEVRVEGLGDRIFAGEVTYISSSAEFTPRSVQTKEERAKAVFAVRVRLPNPDDQLKPGMPADAAFTALP